MESNQQSDLPHVVLMEKKILDRSKLVWSILIKGLSNHPSDASDDIRSIHGWWAWQFLKKYKWKKEKYKYS